MTDKELEKIALLYCKWCPKDCQDLTTEERVSCLAVGGFVDDIWKLGYRLIPELKLISDEEILAEIPFTLEQDTILFQWLKQEAQSQLDADMKEVSK